MKASILVLQSALLVAGVMNFSEAAQDCGFMSFFSSSRATEEDSNMLYSGFRSLSWVSPKETDDDGISTTKGKKGTAAGDDDTAAATDDDSTSISSSGTSSSSLAKAALDTGTDDDSTTSTAKSSSAAATTTTSSTATDTSGGGGGNSTAGGNATDVEDETKAPKMNPIIDDMALLFDDDSIKANATSLFPPEEEQPESWPFIVTIIFLVAAVALIGATCYKQYRKRNTYTSIPTDIDV